MARRGVDKLYDQVLLVAMTRCRSTVNRLVSSARSTVEFPTVNDGLKIGPALAAGNCGIVKPAEQTTLTALRMAELAMEAGLPRGVLQVMPGDGPTTGRPLGLHPGVDLLSFTGSTETGRRFLAIPLKTSSGWFSSVAEKTRHRDGRR